MMDPLERFHRSLLLYEGFQFSNTRAEIEKNYNLGVVAVQNIGSLKLCHVLLKQSSENVFVFR